MKLKRYLAAAAVAAVFPAAAQNALHVDAGAKGIPVPRTMYGLFFEDINYAADGGLYAEKIKNRSFEFPQPFMGWRTFGSVTLMDDGPFERNPHYARLAYAGHPERLTGIENEGFFGIAVEEGGRYRLTFWARTAGKADREYVSVHLCRPAMTDENQMFTSAGVEIDSREWKLYEVEIVSPLTEAKASLRMMLGRSGRKTDRDMAVDVEHVSLFPVETFNGCRNGLRRDIAEALAELSPGVFRFPGGCIVEGTDLDNRYRWKNTVGPVENRPLNVNRWNYTFPHRMFPDYYQSCGLGFYEYFLLAEQIGAEPLPVLNCGMACQYQNDLSWNPHACGEALREYVQDALDLVEFANGDATTRWGALRAEMGHPEPFGLKYLAVGNEQWGAEYVEHLEPFVEALRERCPEIRIVGSSGPYYGGEMFEYLWPEMRRLGVDLVDEHFYADENFFTGNADRYDSYPRKGTKVFAGEYACHGRDGKKWNHFNAALLEAAFMTGMERNADVVEMATYAPLLAHAEGWQWRPDLVWFDNLRVVRTCSYYVQQLYAANKGTAVLPLTAGGRPLAGKEGQNGLYASAVRDDSRGEYILKVVNLSDAEQPLSVTFDRLPRRRFLTGGTCTLLHSADPLAENTLDRPDAIVPVTSEIAEGALGADALTASIAPRTFALYRIRYEDAHRR